MILFLDETLLDEDDLFTLQAVSFLPYAPSWTTPIGAAYRLTASGDPAPLDQASLVFNYISSEVPAGEEDFESAIKADYLPTGYFLQRVVINKMLGETAWLFNSDTKPFMLESFDHSGKHEIPLAPGTLAETLSGHYRIPTEKISAALTLVEFQDQRRIQ